MKIPKDRYPWIVRNRLSKSLRILPYKEARAYYRSLKRCKTRSMWQDIPLSVVVTSVMQKYAKKAEKMLFEPNPILVKLKI